MPTQSSTDEVDIRINPEQKPRPANYPKHDPFFFLLPLCDSYVAPTRPASTTNPTLNPILAPSSDLPPKMLLVTPTIDILLDRQVKFAKRLQENVEEARRDGVKGPRHDVKMMIFENCMHGWLERESPCCAVSRTLVIQNHHKAH
jgi:acetyl esterase/lipase